MSYIIREPSGPQVLYWEGTLRSPSPILQRCPWILKSNILGLPSGPQVLYYRGTLGSSSSIFWGYLQVLKSRGKKRIVESRDCTERMNRYGIVWITIGSYGSLVRMFRSLYPWVPICHCLEVPLDHHVILFRGTLASSYATVRLYAAVLMSSKILHKI